jgi:hypothetical protein
VADHAASLSGISANPKPSSATCWFVLFHLRSARLRKLREEKVAGEPASSLSFNIHSCSGHRPQRIKHRFNRISVLILLVEQTWHHREIILGMECILFCFHKAANIAVVSYV